MLQHCTSLSLISKNCQFKLLLLLPAPFLFYLHGGGQTKAKEPSLAHGLLTCGPGAKNVFLYFLTVLTNKTKVEYLTETTCGLGNLKYLLSAPFQEKVVPQVQLQTPVPSRADIPGVTQLFSRGISTRNPGSKSQALSQPPHTRADTTVSQTQT